MRLKSSEKLAKTAGETKNQVPWKPLLAVIFVVAMFFVAQVVGSLLVTLFYSVQGLTEAEISRRLSGSVYAQFTYVIITEIVILYAIYRFLRRYKTKFSAIGWRRPRLKDFGYGLVAVIPYYVCFFIIVALVSVFIPGIDLDQKQEIGFDDVQGFLPLALTFLVLVILQPITEEIVVRGFLYSSLKKALPLIYAVIATSLIFAAAHLPAGGPAGPLYIAGIDTFILSLFLIYLREKTGSLWASITLHSIKNGIAFLALFIFKVA